MCSLGVAAAHLHLVRSRAQGCVAVAELQQTELQRVHVEAVHQPAPHLDEVHIPSCSCATCAPPSFPCLGEPLLSAGMQQPGLPSEFCSLVDLVHQQLTRHIYTLISSQPDDDSENVDANAGGTQTGGTCCHLSDPCGYPAAAGLCLGMLKREYRKQQAQPSPWEPVHPIFAQRVIQNTCQVCCLSRNGL